MKFKSLFIVDPKEKKEEALSKFPSSFDTFPSTASQSTNTLTDTAPPMPTMNVPLQCAPHMDKIMKLYETGFESLNRPGIEFFEYFQAVIQAGADNASAYQMALKMLSTLEKTMTKESLISQSQYYIDELVKVHAKYDADGAKMKQDAMLAKSSEGQKLQNDISSLEQQIESLKNQLSSKKVLLSQIDAKYQPQINDLDCKILANNEAKNRILSTINKVVNGIKTNL